MDIWIVEGGQLVQYKRTGQCDQCGACCCAHTIRYDVSASVRTAAALPGGNGGDGADWSGWEGWSTLYGQGVWFWFRVSDVEDEPHQCPSYDVEMKQCTIWQDMEAFPLICRYWPVNPKDIVKFSNCGFSFERVAEEE